MELLRFSMAGVPTCKEVERETRERTVQACVLIVTDSMAGACMCTCVRVYFSIVCRFLNVRLVVCASCGAATLQHGRCVHVRAHMHAFARACV